MKRCLFLLLSICIAQAVCGQTNVSGYISASTTWTLAGSPYIVTGNILVASGATLTIEPGVTVKFDTTKTLQIDGGLIAIGTAQNRITFTANDATPARGSWGRIQFSPTSTDAVFDTAGNYLSGNILKYCDIRYGGGVPGDVTVYCDSAAPYFSNCRIEDCLKHAVYFVNAVGRVDSSSIRNCLGTALRFANPMAAELIVIRDTIQDCADGIVRDGSSSFLKVNVEDCLFARCGYGIVATSPTFIISNNSFDRISTAFYVASYANATITNNIFSANGSVLRGSGTNVIFSNNTVTGSLNTVFGTPSGCGPSGILTSIYVSNFTISDNHFEGNSKGILFASASIFTVQGNMFLNNGFKTIAGCNCTAENVMASFLSGKGVLTKNIFEGNYTTSTGVSDRLIKFDNTWEVSHNIFRNNKRAAIYLYYRSNICNNRFYNNSGAVIITSNSSGTNLNQFHDNLFINNSGGGPHITINNSSTLNSNEFISDSCSVYPMVTITGGASYITNNTFLNSFNLDCPIISFSNSSGHVHNNDFIGNNGLSCLRISNSSTQPQVSFNNFVNPQIQYEIDNQIPFGSGANLNISNNYWGTSSTAHIDSVVRDFFDDGSLSVALYTPVLTSPAFVDTAASCSTASVCTLTIAGADTANVLQPATYSINGSSPITWSVTNGVILSGQGTGSIQIDWGAVGQGTVQVTSLGCPMISRNITLIAPRRIIGTGITLPFIPLPGQH